MRTFFSTPMPPRPSNGRVAALRALRHRLQEATGTRLRSQRGRSEEGFLLIEVVITALIVGLVVVGTFTGLNVAQSTSISEREHNEAIALASESQEALRSDPASTFDSPTASYEHTYTTKFDGEPYTVTQKGSFLNNAGSNSSCSATNPTRQETNSLRLMSIVTWPQQLTAKRAPVTVSSVTTPPTGSALEIDVGNYPTPTAGVSGVTTTVKYHPNESSSTSSLNATTETPGCTVFDALPATSAEVEVGEKAGYVDPAGSSKWPNQEILIAPNYTAHDPVTLNEGGALTAELQYEKKPEYEHARNTGTAKLKEPVTGDTIVAANELMESAPNFELGSAKAGTFASGIYTPVFGTTAAATWASSITTPIEVGGTKYPHGNLFPFPEHGAWQVYAGACTANAPHTLNSSIETPTQYVLGSKTQTVKVPLAYLKLNVYTGKQGAPVGFQETTAYPVTITNTGCKSLTPDNDAAINEPEETEAQTTNSTAWPEYGGHLEHPFLPFGEGELCLAYNTSSKHETFTTKYTLKAEGEYTRNIYLGEPGPTYKETLTGPSGSEPVVTTVTSTQHNATATCA
jgi:type II secretory pathway pseudopilin PulG